jgi:imidazolonepropionase-like amidohydrolase
MVGATLVDGTGSLPRPASAVVFREGRITWAGPASKLERGPRLKVIDVAGKWMIPGLMDANVHIVNYKDLEVLLRYEPGCYDDLAIEATQIALKAGITTVFDTWGPLESLRRVRDRINRGEVIASRIFCAGNIIGMGGPYSADLSLNPSYRDALNPIVVETINRHWTQGAGDELTWMSAEDVGAAVRQYIASRGIDFVKYSGSAHAHGRFLAFSPDAQRAIVEEAHAAGMTAQACTITGEALKVAIAAGVDLLQHGDITGLYPMPQATLDLIVQRQLPCVAFLMTERRVAAFRTQKLMGEPWDQIWAMRDENDRRLIRAGAKLLLGNDATLVGQNWRTSPVWSKMLAGPDPSHRLGEMHLVWLQAARERDMSAMDALCSATRNIAEAYKKEDELGTVEVGKRADMVVLDADPLADVANYGRITHVVKDGVLVDRDRLPERPILTSDAEAERWAMPGITTRATSRT